MDVGSQAGAWEPTQTFTVKMQIKINVYHQAPLERPVCRMTHINFPQAP